MLLLWAGAEHGEEPALISIKPQLADADSSVELLEGTKTAFGWMGEVQKQHKEAGLTPWWRRNVHGGLGQRTTSKQEEMPVSYISLFTWTTKSAVSREKMIGLFWPGKCNCDCWSLPERAQGVGAEWGGISQYMKTGSLFSPVDLNVFCRESLYGYFHLFVFIYFQGEYRVQVPEAQKGEGSQVS